MLLVFAVAMISGGCMSFLKRPGSPKKVIVVGASHARDVVIRGELEYQVERRYSVVSTDEFAAARRELRARS